MKVCRDCKFVVEGSDKCPKCGSAELTDRFSGLLIVLDPEKSEIAKVAQVNSVGRYALKVK
ncbi:MAG: DNA-directed RNA polymerase subunit E'' [Candidatus Micrarchaeota archaeon]|jgi:DNA-directed RNA polymerase subunit E"|nr:DNA-directed RNA polymerase subunit E'' [Candidatus Micrarchaeota archaeon]NYZ60700.1 DNA-directed RNA polymerase subunit E'' [Candidatus Micrarchaeota archaeon]